MAGFVLSDAVEAMTYDFGPDAQGTIPEPSSAAILAFNEGQAALRANTDLSEAEKDDALIALVGTLCSDSPSAEQISALGYRGRMAFVGWIVGTLSPKA